MKKIFVLRQDWKKEDDKEGGAGTVIARRKRKGTYFYRISFEGRHWNDVGTDLLL